MFKYFKRILALLESINSALWYMADAMDGEVDLVDELDIDLEKRECISVVGEVN
jgi:hypothetical protein